MNKKYVMISLYAFMLTVFCQSVHAQPYVEARLWGRLGNHLFITAAATSLALDHGATPIFPDLVRASDPNCGLDINYCLSNIRQNYEKILFRLNASLPLSPPEVVYREPSFNYSPIPYHPNMLLEGWFQSEKYFLPHKQEIVELFAPSEEITQYLQENYASIIEHPLTVSLHLRCYKKENPDFEKVYPTYGRDYFAKAITYFPEDALFVVFSDQIAWAKEELSGIPRQLIFIENEPYYHDLYLMSFCKHQIISNSSFSWWAAYLNTNPNKIVIAPPVWFCPEYNHNSDDLIPEDWIILQN